jgi:hypothetical protein
VVFDRIRETENLYKERGYKFIINKAINDMLGRTLITSGTTFTSAICLYIFAGGTVADIAFAICIGIVLLVIRSWLNKVEERSKLSEDLVSWLKEMGTRLDSQNSNIDQKLMSQMKVFNERLDRASETMQHVQKSIGEFSEIGRSMQQLQEFLQSPKLRGNIGEQVLKELLNQCLPPDCFTLQYGFKNGEKVDAVIKTVNGLIPIDSKFPMSNFKRMIEEQDAKMKEQVQKEFIKDVRTHIKSISQKYILTSEGVDDGEKIRGADLHDRGARALHFLSVPLAGVIQVGSEALSLSFVVGLRARTGSRCGHLFGGLDCGVGGIFGHGATG